MTMLLKSENYESFYNTDGIHTIRVSQNGGATWCVAEIRDRGVSGDPADLASIVAEICDCPINDVATADVQAILLEQADQDVSVWKAENTPNSEASQLRCWEWSGYGNYSDNFGTDSGLNCGIVEEVSFAEAHNRANHDSANSSASVNVLPNSPIEGVYAVTKNSHGGSRNEGGYVIAADLHAARELLWQYEDQFEIIPQEA